MDWRTGGVQLSAKGVVIAILAVIGFRMRVRGRAHMLKVCFRQGRFILRQRTRARPAGTEEERPDNGKRKR